MEPESHEKKEQGIEMWSVSANTKMTPGGHQSEEEEGAIIVLLWDARALCPAQAEDNCLRGSWQPE